MFEVLVGGDSRFMAIHGIGGRERRVWRAVLFALAVVAQLVLPAITMRAQALAAELCVVDNGDGGGDSSKRHPHQQQCLHCRVHDCAALTPPAVRVAGGLRVAAAEPPATTRLAVALMRRAQPPPTGPPAR